MYFDYLWSWPTRPTGRKTAFQPNNYYHELVFLWTGTRHYNSSHFRREDGFLFDPVGFKGSYRDFPEIVHVHISRDGVVAAHNSIADAYNKVNSDYCLCYLTSALSLSRLIKSVYFFYAITVTVALICIAIFVFRTLTN